LHGAFAELLDQFPAHTGQLEIPMQGFIYNKGTVIGFNVPGAIQTVFESLNDVGQSASYFSPSTYPINTHIFVRHPDGTITDLGEFGSIPSALAINNQGRVLIGTYDPFALTGNTYITITGSKSLETVPSLVPGCIVSPAGMNQVGEVIGTAAIDLLASHEHAYVYRNGKIKDLGVLPGGLDSYGYGINNFGQTVGTAVRGNAFHGWVDVNGTFLDVNDLPNGSGKGWTISEARSINDDLGRILCTARFNDGPSRVVVLTPNGILPSIAHDRGD
jgi:probable HAF family extracellular repeat protein